MANFHPKIFGFLELIRWSADFGAAQQLGTTGAWPRGKQLGTGQGQSCATGIWLISIPKEIKVATQKSCAKHHGTAILEIRCFFLCGIVFF